MKKLYAAFLAAAFLILGYGASRADNVPTSPETDIASWQFSGSTNVAVAISSTGQLLVQDGIVTMHEHFESPTVSTQNIFRSPSIATGTLMAGASSYSAGFTQPQYPLVPIYVLWTDFGNSTTSLLSTATISGITGKGEIVSDRVIMSTTPTLGSVAFAKITSFTLSQVSTVNAQALSLFAGIGSTGTFGLCGNVEATGDFFKMKAFNVDYTSYTLNPQYDTIKFTNPPALSTFDVWYRNTRSAPPRPK